MGIVWFLKGMCIALVVGWATLLPALKKYFWAGNKKHLGLGSYLYGFILNLMALRGTAPS